MADRSVRVVVRGVVQGVGFRYSTHREAHAVGARGYVRNLRDGSVEAVFEGSHEVIERALAFVRLGPPGSRVTGVEVEPISFQGHSDFEILP